MKKKKLIPDLIDEKVFKTGKAYNDLKVTLETDGATLTDFTIDGEELIFLKPKQAISLASMIMKAYNHLSIDENEYPENVVIFRRK